MVAASITAVGAVTAPTGASAASAGGQDDSEFAQLLSGMGIDTPPAIGATPADAKLSKPTSQADNTDDVGDLAAQMLALCGVPMTPPVEPAAAFIPAFIAADAAVTAPPTGLTPPLSAAITDTAITDTVVVGTATTDPTAALTVASNAAIATDITQAATTAPMPTNNLPSNNAPTIKANTNRPSNTNANNPTMLNQPADVPTDSNASTANPSNNLTTQDMQWLRSANQAAGDGANVGKPNADTKSGAAKYSSLAALAANRAQTIAAVDSGAATAPAAIEVPQVMATASAATTMLATAHAEDIDSTGDEMPSVKLDASTTNVQVPQFVAAQPATDSYGVDTATRHQLRNSVGSHQWANELGDKLTMLASTGTQSATLHMTPADLGPIQVRIELQQNQASVWFTAEHADTRSALEQSLPRLREMFTTQGMSLTDAGVFGDRSRQQANYQQPSSDLSAATRVVGEESAADTSGIRSISLSMLDAYA